jgi:hypothetical protein
LFLTALQRPDFSHITLVIFPALSLFPLLLTTTFRLSFVPKLFLIWHSASLSMLLLPLAVRAFTHSFWFVDTSQYLTIQFVKQNCTSSPYIYAGPFVPGLYFETKKLNPTRYALLLTNFNTSVQFLDAKKDVELYRPQCVVINYRAAEKFNYDRDNVLERYIASNYELAYRAGFFNVFALRD